MKKFKEILLIFVFFDEFVNFFENFKNKKAQTLWSLTFQCVVMGIKLDGAFKIAKFVIFRTITLVLA